jgi:hypothetical protein
MIEQNHPKDYDISTDLQSLARLAAIMVEQNRPKDYGTSIDLNKIKQKPSFSKLLFM